MTNTALYEKLSLAMKSCSYIEKTGENTFHGYSYVTSSDVLERVNDALTSVGLITAVTPYERYKLQRVILISTLQLALRFLLLI